MSIEVVVVNTFEAQVPVPAKEFVVPVDPESIDRRAVTTAVTLATQLGASIAFVAVAEPGAEVPSEWRLRLHDLVEEVKPAPARAVIARASTVAEGVLASIGDLGEAVVCMTTDAPGRLRDAFDLTSSSAIVHHVECPIVLCGPDAQELTTPVTEVMAFVDTSDAADTVVETAAAWAAAMRVPVWVVEVVEPDADVGPDVNETSYVARLAHRHGRPGQDVEWEVLHDREPAHAIDRFLSDDHRGALAVVGSHGRRGWAELRLGSVSMRTAHHAPRPILLVPVRPG